MSIPRKLVFGDIHGGLHALEAVLDQIQPTQSDEFIFLGDYVDGWSQAYETVEFLIDFGTSYSCRFLRGNHDDLLLGWLKEGVENPLWLHSGGAVSKRSYESKSDNDRDRHIAFLEALLDYHLDQENRLFVHAGFTNLRGVAHEYISKNFYWDRTLWETALSLDPQLNRTDSRYPSRLQHYHEIFIGHTPVTRIGKDQPYKAANIWNVDTGAAFQGPLSALEVGSKVLWQSKPVHLYYPAESGRNGQG